MGDVEGRRDINNALARIRSEKADERLNGLADLKKIIKENRQRPELKKVKDGGYHTIFETVFRVVKTDSSNLVRASKTARARIESRLSTCASLVRLIVEVALPKIRYKTVKAIVDHVIQTLPTADAGYCEPLLNDYLKALATLLGFKAHPEHLLDDQWHLLVDFCIALAGDMNRSVQNEDSHSTNEYRNRISRAVTPSSSARRSNDMASQRAAYPSLRHSDREIVLCMQHLTSVTNAPVCERANVVLTTLVELLQSYSKVSSIQHSVFETINSTMSRVMTNDLSLALRVSSLIMPLFQRYWESKDASLREAMLVTLSYVEILIPQMISLDTTQECVPALDAIVEVLRNDYCSRREREQLQLEDLSLKVPESFSARQIPLSTSMMEVRVGAFKAEHPWCLISSSAAIVVALERHKRDQNRGDTRTIAKRRKLSSPVDDLFELARSPIVPEKLYALQMLPFVLDVLGIETNIVQSLLDVLLPSLSDDNGLIASWAMIAASSAACQQATPIESLRNTWLQVWRIVARRITSSTTCKAACQLLSLLLNVQLVKFNDVADIADAITRSFDLNGPAECDECATKLWTILLVLQGSAQPSSMTESCSSALHWLFNRWSPSKTEDRQHTVYLAQQFSTFSSLQLICLSLGLPTATEAPARAVTNLESLSQAKLDVARNKKLMQYLLLTEEDTPCRAEHTLMSDRALFGVRPPASKAQLLASYVLEWFATEASAFRDGCLFAIGKSNISSDIVRILVAFQTIGLALLASPKLQGVSHKEQCAGQLDEIREGIRTVLLHQSEGKELLKGFYDAFGSFIHTVDQVIRRDSLLSKGAIAASHGFDRSFWSELLKANESSEADDEQHSMDLGDTFGSQGTNSLREIASSGSIHLEIPAATNPSAFRASLGAKICLMSDLTFPDDLGSDFSKAAVSIIEFLTSMQAQDFLACRDFLRQFLGSDLALAISKDDAYTMLEYLAQVLIRPYEFERCEVSLGVALDVMSSLAERWTASDGGEVSEIGASLYSWFIEIALKKNISSPHVHTCISAMLHKIIKIRPEYARSLQLPSARTSLFEVLREGNIVTKFHIGNKIADIFGLFILKEHEHILEDVIVTLPNDPTWMEGIALRLYILGHLAASWSTLLRRCVYAILECPRYVPNSTGYAKKSLGLTTTALKLPAPQDLFKLFVSQILYTWLETQPIRSIPYSVFGYRTLPSFLRDVQDDIVGHVVMRGKDDEAAQLAEDLRTTFKKLLEVSFSKAAAYSISRDIAIPPSTSSQAPKAEARLRNVIGKEDYKKLVTVNFAKILAIFLKTMDPDGQFEKGLQKHAEAKTVYAAYNDIVSKTSSEKPLPLSQQPSFKAKYLLDQIEFLCHRTGYNHEAVWTPSTYTYVFRETLNGIHPALGSLHSCAVLRRVRILVCLAGSVALEGYPLEMTLHSLRPYLTDPQCADETTALVQYLVEQGVSYLKEVPSFIAGHAVSILTSMKAFFESTQDSTTQESQFRTTMSMAQTFHTWFSGFLEKYASPKLSIESARCLKSIVNAAQSIGIGGNARSGTYESELLLEVLEDQRSGRDLLDQPTKDTILKFLCTPFEVPPSFREDILGSDRQCARYAPTLLKICKRGVCSPEFLLWAGRVLGRAYAGNGLLEPQMAFEIPQENSDRPPPNNVDTLASNSRISILRTLCDILLGDDSLEIGVAETVLRTIVTETDGTDYFLDCEQCIPPSLLKSLLWRQYRLPSAASAMAGTDLSEAANFDEYVPAAHWIQQLLVGLAMTAKDDSVLSNLAQIVTWVGGLAEKVFPYVLHLVLLQEADGHQQTKKIMSQAYAECFKQCDASKANVIHSSRILLQALLYLKSQPLPHETTVSDRTQWLQLDYRQAANTATCCSMFKTALMLLETYHSELMKLESLKVSRRSSAAKRQDKVEHVEPTDILLSVYEKIDEPDAFYGVRQPSSLLSMMAQLEYEHAGFKSLSFRGAHYDAQIRQFAGDDQSDKESMVRALDQLNLNGLSQSLLNGMSNTTQSALDSILRTARRLEQWDLPAPVANTSSAGTIFRTFQNINNAVNQADILSGLNVGFTEMMNQIVAGKVAKSSMHSILGNLATLTEADEILSSRRSEQMYEVLSRFKARDQWMYAESFEHIKDIISCRETLSSLLSKRPKLRELLNTSIRDARAAESRMLLASSNISRHHDALQNALSTTTYLNQLVKPCEEAGVDISAAVQFESANVLWGQGEMTASIKMLHDLVISIDADSQWDHVGKPELLATLGHQISVARLEKPDEIIDKYLGPAIKELHQNTTGDQAGQVFHEFASFCDQQLQNSDGMEDYRRIQTLRKGKAAEITELDEMIKYTNSQTRDRRIFQSMREKAQAWFDLDDREYQRLRETRQTFLRQSLENYLLCLNACDKYDNAALRFSALWLENYDNEIANAAVSKHLDQVGSRKFAALMNQWSSRLLDEPGQFQTLLFGLVLRICVDHPYHGMYQIFASSKTKGGKDDVALSRNAAANKIVNELKAHKRAHITWIALHNTNITFVRLAAERPDDATIKPGAKVPLRKFANGQKVEQDVQKQKVPPPTARIELRPDRNYSKVAFIARFQPECGIANGLSMPKIVTAIGTDGKKYKQLFKGGNDDLRQDSIMEQVFEQVSSLLHTQRATRQRNLRIRTYKVLPLTATAGVIEFVPNTIPLHDYLLPAHQRHFPKDLKPNNARKFIADAQNRSADTRIDQFRKVCRQFNPVMRYFFTERFESPDDWFEKRLAYTRSTAAISILGYILGLGDRHGHNILLDEKTGEVVHIDLGIAFEQGRVLPVPEVVPFRLTRDLVDGMGITKTEGVFRRCCEFTLEALRNESYSIMTILDVLRYDPLYNWSVSPLRLKKMQNAQTEDPKLPREEGVQAGRKKGNEEGEAERALTVVKKKLSKTLSVQATVNELIQQATDERNLAVLYCGWAAYV